jgi:hypothetical protein
MWNTKPLLIPNLILVHLTIHTISSSLQVEQSISRQHECHHALDDIFQGLTVALIYTLINSDVQRELFRSIDRWLMRHHSSWQPPTYFRTYIMKLDNQRLYSCAYQTRSTIPIQYRDVQTSIDTIKSC